MNIEQSITAQNEQLFREIISKIQVTFEIDASENCWTAKPLGPGRYLITAPDHNPSPESLTHELLHVQLDLNGFVGTDRILEDQNFLSCPWQLIDAINNNLAHFHMLEHYISLGFSKEKFLSFKQIDLEAEYFAEIINLNSKVDPLQYLNFLFQTIIETNWYKLWLSLDTTTIDDDLKSKNDELYADTNLIINEWIESSSDKNLETFLRLQKVYTVGRKTLSLKKDF